MCGETICNLCYFHANRKTFQELKLKKIFCILSGYTLFRTKFDNSRRGFKSFLWHNLLINLLTHCWSKWFFYIFWGINIIFIVIFPKFHWQKWFLKNVMICTCRRKSTFILFLCLTAWCLTPHSGIFRSYRDVTLVAEWLQSQDLCLKLTASE